MIWSNEQAIEIVIVTTEGEYTTVVEIENPIAADERDTAITEAAVLWCSDNGHSYVTWDE